MQTASEPTNPNETRNNQLLHGSIVRRLNKFVYNYKQPNSASGTATNGQVGMKERGTLMPSTGDVDKDGAIIKLHDVPLSQYSALISYLVVGDRKDKYKMQQMASELAAPGFEAVKVVPRNNEHGEETKNVIFCAGTSSSSPRF